MTRWLIRMVGACIVVIGGMMGIFNLPSLPSTPADDYISDGVSAYQSGDYSEAVDNFNRALRTSNSIRAIEVEEVYTILGLTYTELGQYEDAVHAHEMSVEINSNYEVGWLTLGLAYSYTNDFEKAEASYLQAIDLNPDYPQARISLGSLYINQNDAQAAIEHLEYALDLDYSDISTLDVGTAYGNLALAFAMEGLIDEADFMLGEARERGNPDVDAIAELIELYR